MGGYDPKGREIITSFVQVMRYLGTSYGVMRKEKCTGDPARRLGNDLIFQQLAESNLEAMQQQKVKKIISICPHCVRTIQEDWKEFGVSPEIEHHSEFLARHQAQLPHNKTDEKIVYHDPCYLGRYRDVYDEPRSVIANAGVLVEPERTRERRLLLWRRRWPGFSRRRDRAARQRGARPGTGGYRSYYNWGCMSVL